MILRSEAVETLNMGLAVTLPLRGGICRTVWPILQAPTDDPALVAAWRAWGRVVIKQQSAIIEELPLYIRSTAATTPEGVSTGCSVQLGAYGGRMLYVDFLQVTDQFPSIQVVQSGWPFDRPADFIELHIDGKQGLSGFSLRTALFADIA